METLLKNITTNPNDVSKLKSFLYEKDNWTKEEINSLGKNDLKNFAGLCMEAYRVLENDPLKKLIESGRPYTYKEFDEAYYEFNNAMNFLLKNDIDPSKIKNGKINFSKAQEAYANLNNRLICSYLDKLKDISENMTADEKNEIISSNEEIRSQILQLKSLFDLSNEVSLVAKLDYQVLGKIRQDKLRILKEKYSVDTKNGMEVVQKLSSKVSDPKNIYKSFASSISDKKQTLEDENKKLEHQMLDDEYKQMMINNLTTDESINRFNEQLKEDSNKEKENEKNNRKIIIYKAADKIATAPIALYNKMKSFIGKSYSKSKEAYQDLNEKVQHLKTKYEEKIMTEEQIRELSNDAKWAKLGELDISSGVSVSDGISLELRKAMDDAFAIFDETFNKKKKESKKAERTVKIIGGVQHLIRLPYDVVNKIKASEQDFSKQNNKNTFTK